VNEGSGNLEESPGRLLTHQDVWGQQTLSHLSDGNTTEQNYQKGRMRKLHKCAVRTIINCWNISGLLISPHRIPFVKTLEQLSNMNCFVKQGPSLC